MLLIRNRIKWATLATVALVATVASSTTTNAYGPEDLESSLQKQGFGCRCGIGAGNHPQELQDLAGPAQRFRALWEHALGLNAILEQLNPPAHPAEATSFIAVQMSERPIDEHSKERLDFYIWDNQFPEIIDVAQKAISYYYLHDTEKLRNLRTGFAPGVEEKDGELREYNETFFDLCQQVRNATKAKDEQLAALPGVLREPLDIFLNRAFGLNNDPYENHPNPKAKKFRSQQYNLLQGLEPGFSEEYAQAVQLGSASHSFAERQYPDLYASFRELSKAHEEAKAFYLENITDRQFGSVPEISNPDAYNLAMYSFITSVKPSPTFTERGLPTPEAVTHRDVLNAIEKLLADVEIPLEGLIQDYTQRLETVHERLRAIADGTSEEAGLATRLGLDGQLELEEIASAL